MDRHRYRTSTSTSRYQSALISPRIFEGPLVLWTLSIHVLHLQYPGTQVLNLQCTLAARILNVVSILYTDTTGTSLERYVFRYQYSDVFQYYTYIGVLEYY